MASELSEVNFEIDLGTITLNECFLLIGVSREPYLGFYPA
jgi:hypothetical protein